MESIHYSFNPYKVKPKIMLSYNTDKQAKKKTEKKLNVSIGYYCNCTLTEQGRSKKKSKPGPQSISLR